MKLSTNTIQVLKNFASINQNLVIKEGNTISTMSAMKNIVAKAEVEETFPKQVAIYDLNEFLASLSLFKNPILTFEDSFLNITEENGRKTVKYFYSDPSVVTSPTKEITMPSNEVTFMLTDADISEISKISEISTVRGDYEYWDYGCDGYDDRGKSVMHIWLLFKGRGWGLEAEQ